RSVAGRDGAVRAEGGTQLGQYLHSRVRPRRLVDGKGLHALLAADLDRNDLVRELAMLLGRPKVLLRTGGKAVLRSAGKLRMGDEVLVVPARMLTREGIVEAIAQHAVVNLRRAHAIAPTAAIHQVRRTIHVLHPAGDCGVDLAGRDLLRGGDDGLRARAAD